MPYAAASPAPPLGELREQPTRRAQTDDPEGELVERAKRDPLQFAPLYDLHFDRIYRFVYARVKQQAAAEDVTADVFIKALHAMPRYQHTGRPFAAWLYRIASNAITDRGRAAHPWLPLEDFRDHGAGCSAEELALDRDEIQRIWARVERLPRDQQVVLRLRFREDMRVKDIAAVMGRTSGAVKVLLCRAVGRLRIEAAALRPAV